MSTGNVVGIVGGGGATTVDTVITDGSGNAVSGNAVHDALAALSGVTLDTDDTMAANSDTVAASQKATKSFVETRAVVDLGSFV